MPTDQFNELRQQMPSEMKPSMDVGAIKSQPTLTFGQRLVGLNFNPSKDSNVDQAKKLCAELADLIYADYKNNETTELKNELYHHTIGEILNAQMNVVKLLTLKY